MKWVRMNLDYLVLMDWVLISNDLFVNSLNSHWVLTYSCDSFLFNKSRDCGGMVIASWSMVIEALRMWVAVISNLIMQLTTLRDYLHIPLDVVCLNYSSSVQLSLFSLIEWLYCKFPSQTILQDLLQNNLII